MSRPGTTLTRSETPPPRSAPTATGPWFVAGFTGKGTTADARVGVKSLSEWVTKFGSRTDAPFLYDAAEVYFREGGSLLFTSRVFGPTPVTASLQLDDATPGGNQSLVVSASSPGAWANGAAGGLSVDVDTSGADFILTVFLNAVLMETSPALADQAAAVAWAANSSYIRIALGAAVGDPVATAGAQNLAGGTDDRANATDGTWLAALNLFTRDLGPGQASLPGMTTATRHGQAVDHAAANNRIALLDAADTPTKATLLAIEAAIGSSASNKRYAALFAPWVVIEGVTAGTTRTVPPSAVVAGLMSHRDGEGRTPNEPAAGELGQSATALRLSQVAFSDADRADLNVGNVNLLREMYGGTRVYGYRTLSDPVTDANWINLGNARLFMAITAQGDSIAERFVFRQLDGRRRTTTEYGGALTGMLLPYWEQGSLYGATPEEAFNVDIGASVNTDLSMAAGNLKASIALRMSQYAEEVILELVKTRTTEAVA